MQLCNIYNFGDHSFLDMICNVWPCINYYSADDVIHLLLVYEWFVMTQKNSYYTYSLLHNRSVGTHVAILPHASWLLEPSAPVEPAAALPLCCLWHSVSGIKWRMRHSRGVRRMLLPVPYRPIRPGWHLLWEWHWVLLQRVMSHKRQPMQGLLWIR